MLNRLHLLQPHRTFSAKWRINTFQTRFLNKQNQIALEALLTYRKLYGHLNVERSFKVPSEPPWPKTTWGTGLGTQVNRWRSKRKDLEEEMQLLLDASGMAWSEREIYEEKIVRILKKYKDIFGHMHIDRGFMIPVLDVRWDASDAGFQLGSHAYKLRKSQSTLKQDFKDTLDSMGFVWDNTSGTMKQYRYVANLFYNVKPDGISPEDFRVPSEEPWPEELWRCKLPEPVVKLYRQKKDLASRRKTSMSQHQLKQERVLRMLRIFFEENKTTNVPKHFCIPHREPWSEEDWGYSLGKKVVLLRLRRDTLRKEFKTELENLGFSWRLSDANRVQLIQLLRLYHEIYGHCNIAHDFTVPAQEPWPKLCWNRNLRRDLTALRSKAQKGLLEPSTIALLKELGFALKKSDSIYIDVVQMLNIYKQLNGDVAVNVDFVVPAEVPWPPHTYHQELGKQVHHLRTNMKSIDGDIKVALAKLGFEFGPPPPLSLHPCSIEVLEIYKSKYGDLNPPLGFIVPNEDPWPEVSWGIDLGKKLDQIRMKKSKWPEDIKRGLDNLGFIWSLKEDIWSTRTLPALKTYRELHGHVNIPLSFRVPFTQEWPKETHGLPLGSRVNVLRTRKSSLSAEQFADLTELGMVWKVNEHLFHECICPALRMYHQLYGNLNIPFRFVVPPNSPDWPEATWGLTLGTRIRSMRQRKSYIDMVEEHYDELHDLGFEYDDDMRSDLTPDEIAQLDEGFRIFRQLNIHSLMYAAFVIPEDEAWPKHLHNVPLGRIVAKVRFLHQKNRVPEVIRETLSKEHFSWTLNTSEYKAVPLIEHFHSLYGHCDIPVSYTIPEADDQWPVETSGEYLGRLVRTLKRSRCVSDEAKTRLDSIGFKWKQCIWTEKVLPGMERYIELHGHSHVPWSFRIPENSSWPTKLHNYALGQALSRLRREIDICKLPENTRRRFQEIGICDRSTEALA